MKPPNSANLFFISTIFLALVLSGCRTADPGMKCPFELQQVLSQCDLSNVEPMQPIAWRRMSDEKGFIVKSVVLVGKSAEKYILVDAYRNSKDTRPLRDRWMISAISRLYANLQKPAFPREDWILGQREFASYPTQPELEQFLSDMMWAEHGSWRIEFEGKQELRSSRK